MAKQEIPKGKRVYIGDLLGLPYAPVVESGPLVPPAYVAQVLPQDVKAAKRKDHLDCAIACSISRQAGFKGGVHASIGSRFAHIPMKVPYKGDVKTIIAKMQATAETIKAIKTFDKTGKMPEAGFMFVPIAQSHTYAARRVYHTLAKGKTVKKRAKPQRPRSKHLRSLPGIVSAAPRFDA